MWQRILFKMNVSCFISFSFKLYYYCRENGYFRGRAKFGNLVHKLGSVSLSVANVAMLFGYIFQLFSFAETARNRSFLTKEHLLSIFLLENSLPYENQRQRILFFYNPFFNSRKFDHWTFPIKGKVNRFISCGHRSQIFSFI